MSEFITFSIARCERWSEATLAVSRERRVREGIGWYVGTTLLVVLLALTFVLGAVGMVAGVIA